MFCNLNIVAVFVACLNTCELFANTDFSVFIGFLNSTVYFSQLWALHLQDTNVCYMLNKDYNAD